MLLILWDESLSVVRLGPANGATTDSRNFRSVHGISMDRLAEPCVNGTMDIGAYHRIEGELIRGAAGMFLLARNGMQWQLGKLHDVTHLIGKLVVVEGIKSGVEALNVSWVEAIATAAPWIQGRQKADYATM